MKEKVMISIFGGVAEVEELSNNVEVVIKDYDIEGIDLDDKNVEEDEHGEYIERIYA
jgi:uncharacterized lipoprotein YddW (UPF0748 family)